MARGDTLLWDNGRIVLWVSEVAGERVQCRVVVGGVLSGGKGLNRPLKFGLSGRFARYNAEF